MPMRRVGEGAAPNCRDSAERPGRANPSPSWAMAGPALARPAAPAPAPGRRAALATGAALLAARGARPPPAAAGLAELPAAALRNEYWLVRAGESVAEAEGYVLSKPVAKASASAGLSARGRRQARARAAPALREACGGGGCWVWAAMGQAAYETGEEVAAALGVVSERRGGAGGRRCAGCA
jgi:hypothetical protein